MKNKILIIFSLLLLPLSVFAEASMADLRNLVNQMMEVTPLQELKSEKKQMEILESDKKIDSVFDRLSIYEKNIVLKLLRDKSSKNAKKIQQSEALNEMLQDVQTLAEKNGKSLLELSKEEAINYSRASNFSTKSALTNCSLRQFPNWNSYFNYGSNSFYKGWITSIVKNSPDEVCDYEIFYNTSKSYVYGTTYRARTILNYYNGLSKRTWYGNDSLIAGFWAVFPLYGTGVFDNLHNEIVIW